jgi:hypothetical protein
VHSFLKLRLPATVPTLGARRQEAHVITIGVDPHKSSHTAVAVDETGQVLGERRVPADKATLRRLGRWAEHWPERTWAIEGANGLGHLLAQQLVTAGEVVVDVPAMLASRARQLDRGHGRKTDEIDAQTVAAVAQRRPDLRRVAPEDHAGVLRLLSDRRDELTAQRRRVINRLHRLLRDLRSGGAPIGLSAAIAARLLATIRPHGAADLERKATESPFPYSPPAAFGGHGLESEWTVTPSLVPDPKHDLPRDAPARLGLERLAHVGEVEYLPHHGT